MTQKITLTFPDSFMTQPNHLSFQIFLQEQRLRNDNTVTVFYFKIGREWAKWCALPSSRILPKYIDAPVYKEVQRPDRTVAAVY